MKNIITKVIVAYINLRDKKTENKNIVNVTRKSSTCWQQLETKVKLFLLEFLAQISLFMNFKLKKKS